MKITAIHTDLIAPFNPPASAVVKTFRKGKKIYLVAVWWATTERNIGYEWCVVAFRKEKGKEWERDVEIPVFNYGKPCPRWCGPMNCAHPEKSEKKI